MTAPRRKKRQAAALDHRTAAAAHKRLVAPLAASASLTASAFVIHPRRSKWGPRRHFLRRELAMVAIAELYPTGGLPKRATKSIVRDVNKILERDGHREVERKTVKRALADMHAANR